MLNNKENLRARERVYAIKEVNRYDILFGCLSLIQVFAILSTFSETRVATTLGASYPLLADIIL